MNEEMATANTATLPHVQKDKMCRLRRPANYPR